MLLNNYWIWKKYIEGTDCNISNNVLLTNVLTGRNGNPCNLLINSTASSSIIPKTVSNKVLCQNMYLAIGTGTTQPTKEDYNLSEEVIFSSLTYTRNEYINDDGILVKAFGVSGFNGTVQDKLITEAILYKNIYTEYNKDTTVPVSFVHEVFQTPILIEANKNFMINFEWTEQ